MTPSEAAQNPKLLRALKWSEYAKIEARFGIPRAEAQALRAALGLRRGERPEVRVEEAGGELEVESDGEQIRTLDELLAAAQVDLTTWRVERWTANTWAKNWQVKAHLARRPEFLDLPEPPAFKPREVSPGPATVVAFGDAHFGFVGDDPTHDQRALAGALGVVKTHAPAVVVMLPP